MFHCIYRNIDALTRTFTKNNEKLPAPSERPHYFNRHHAVRNEIIECCIVFFASPISFTLEQKIGAEFCIEKKKKPAHTFPRGELE